MKKIWCLVFVFLLLGSFSKFVVSETMPAELEGAKQALDQIGEGADKVQEFQDFTEEDRWDYLSAQWQKLLLESKVIQSIDSFLSKFSIVFKVLFARDYSLSISLVGIMILWFFVFLTVGEVINAWGIIRGVSAYLAGFMFTIILAQARVLEGAWSLFHTIVFSSDYFWVRMVSAVAIIACLILVQFLAYKYANFLKERRIERYKGEFKFKQNVFMKFVDKFRQTSTK